MKEDLAVDSADSEVDSAVDLAVDLAVKVDSAVDSVDLDFSAVKFITKDLFLIHSVLNFKLYIFQELKK